MPTAEGDVFERPFTALPAEDELLAAVLRWHFSPETGSPFWLSRARTLGLDPLRDVHTVADLARFPDVSAEWRTVPAADLIPRGCLRVGLSAEVYESGGTTGAPKRIVEIGSRRRGVQWVSRVLTEHGADRLGAGDWLHVGPTGPHIVGRSVRMFAGLRGSLCHTIDFDPRWVRRCLADERPDDVARYVQHVVAQAVDVLRTQPVGFVFATPAVLEAVAADARALELFQRRARVLIWSGTSISSEALRVLEEELFPESLVLGLYGNSMMGIAPQRPRQDSDPERCVFQPFHPYSLVQVVDPERPDVLVPYGERGQVKVHLLTRDLFLPNCLERDSVVRVRPVADGPGADGVAGVRPMAAGRQQVIEGVY